MRSKLPIVVFSASALAGGVATAAVPAAAQSTVLRATTEWSVGGASDTREALAFTLVSGLALTADGGILAVDLTSGSGAIVSPDGKLVRAFGGAGRGPGQLSLPCCISRSPDGDVWVRELAGRRYSVFRVTPEGLRFSSTVAMPTQSDSRLSPVRVLASGVVHTSPLPPLNGQNRFSQSVLSKSGAAQSDDTLLGARVDEVPQLVIEGKVPGGAVRNMMASPFGARWLFAIGPRGEIATALTSSYTITVRDASGALRAPIRGTTSPVSISAVERDSALNDIDKWARRFNKTGREMEWKVPRAKPPIREIGFSAEGELWVIKHVARGQPQQADIFSAQGALVARAEWPADVSLDLMAVSRSAAAGVRVDEDGAPVLVRLRFTPATLSR